MRGPGPAAGTPVKGAERPPRRFPRCVQFSGTKSVQFSMAIDRSRRTYYCPHGGYQGHRSPCPRCGDKCEPIPARRKKT